MRLINVGAGEVVDRLTILALKILYGDQAGKPTDHFAQERNALLTQLRSRTTMNGLWFEHALGLGAVNAALWYAEDTLRQFRSQDEAAVNSEAQIDAAGAYQLREMVRVAFRIQALNDQRAALIEAINKQTGDHLGSEKLT